MAEVHFTGAPLDAGRPPEPQQETGKDELDVFRRIALRIEAVLVVDPDLSALAPKKGSKRVVHKTVVPGGLDPRLANRRRCGEEEVVGLVGPERQELRDVQREIFV